MRVHINAGGREVTIDCADANVSVRDVTTEALAAWKATDGAQRPSDGPASFGLVTGERREQFYEPLASGYERVVKA